MSLIQSFMSIMLFMIELGHNLDHANFFIDPASITPFPREELNVADHICVYRLLGHPELSFSRESRYSIGYTHHGIVSKIDKEYIKVIHPIPDEDNFLKKNDIFKETSLEKFLNGGVLEKAKYQAESNDSRGVNHVESRLLPDKILQNAQNYNYDYDLLSRNCENFAFICSTGQNKISNQVKTVCDVLCGRPEFPKLTKEKIQSVSQRYKNSGKRWTQEAENELLTMHSEGCSTDKLSTHFKRSKRAITLRLRRLK